MNSPTVTLYTTMGVGKGRGGRVLGPSLLLKFEQKGCLLLAKKVVYVVSS